MNIAERCSLTIQRLRTRIAVGVACIIAVACMGDALLGPHGTPVDANSARTIRVVLSNAQARVDAVTLVVIGAAVDSLRSANQVFVEKTASPESTLALVVGHNLSFLGDLYLAVGSDPAAVRVRITEAAADGNPPMLIEAPRTGALRTELIR